jgi:hypothetical protein
VSFSGPPLESAVMRAALDSRDSRWEGSEGHFDDATWRHRALVGAARGEEAVETVGKALAPYGSFADFHAAPVTDTRGEIKRTPIRSWEEIDWDRIHGEVVLSELQRILLGRVLNRAEPTWIMLDAPDVPDDRGEVEAALRDLEQRGIVYSKVEQSGETGRERAPENWWALTDEGWDLLGLIKSPGYW